MARDSEYLTSNRRVRYPFADDTTILSEDSKSAIIFGCFVDALVQVKSSESSTVPKITGISLTSHTLSFSLISSRGLPDESISLTCTRTNSRFSVIKGESSWCWYVFVISSDGIKDYEDAKESIGDVSAKIIELNKRCIGYTTSHVTSLMVYGGEQKNESGSRYTREEAMLHDPDVIITDNIVLTPGYNMVLAEEDDNGVSISALPGEGMGYAPCNCEDTTVEFKTPGLLSNDGHVRIFNDTCYDLVPSKYTDENGTLTMHVKCKACCTCGMYEYIVNSRLVPIKDQIIADKESIYATFATYETNVAKWNERITKVLPEDIVITVTGVGLDAAATNLSAGAQVSGMMNRCGYSVLIRNDSFVDVTITLDDFDSNGQTFESQVSYMKESSTPVVTPVDLETSDSPIFTMTLASGRSANLTFFVRLNNMVKTDEQSGFIAKFNISAYQGDRLVVTKYEELGI